MQAFTIHSTVTVDKNFHSSWFTDGRVCIYLLKVIFCDPIIKLVTLWRSICGCMNMSVKHEYVCCVPPAEFIEWCLFLFFLSFPYHSAFFVFMNILETGLSHIKVKPDSSCREHTIRRFIDCRVLPTRLWFANGTRHPPTFKGKLFVRRRAYFCSGSRPLCPCRRASGPLAYFDK